jgi:signal transduction histidine kinase/ActR/RegA family two-component response regulator
MKRWYDALPVHRKLVAMALATTMLTLLAATTGLIGFDIWRYRIAAADDVESLAQVIAENSAAALAFADPEAATETVATTRVRPTVIRVCLYLPDDTLFASYARPGSPPCASHPYQSQRWSMLSARVPVTRNHRTLGSVVADRDLSDLGSRIAVTVGAGLVTLLLAGALAFALAQRLNRSVSAPIVELAAAARQIGSPDYAIPQIRANPDEIGELVQSLTGMMQRLQDANSGLLIEIDERRRVEAEREVALVREREASRLKDEFLAAVSHELRTPLNAIVGWVQILKMGNTDPDTLQKAVSTIARNAHAQARVIEDLVDVSRIVTGKLHLRFEAVDLRRPVEAGAEVNRPSALAKNAVLDVRLPAESCLVNGDSDRLQQVVSNLVSNAIKFSPGGGRIDVTLQHVEGAYEVRVADTGIGIAADFLPHVFERFRQSDGSMTREYGGLGLGLAIVKELTELHGGAVAVSSGGVGQGAQFVVRLPALVALGAGPAEPVRELAMPQAALAGISVLAVDDNPDALDVVSTTLATAGAAVRVARDGREAIASWRAEPADVLVCDLAMPHMDGFAVLRQLQQEPAVRGVRAIALTAHASQEYVDRTSAAGFVGHLAKPFAAADLVVAVARAAAAE